LLLRHVASKAVYAFGVLFLALGFSLLWYGVLQVVTAGYRGRGGTFVGFSCIVRRMRVAIAAWKRVEV